MSTLRTVLPAPSETTPGKVTLVIAFVAVLLAFAIPRAQVQAQDNTDDSAVRLAEGLWEYTDLITKDGQSLPLTGVFLIADGTFVQQSIFDGKIFAEQGSMAHAGPYWAGGAGVMLRSNQTLSMDPQGDEVLTSLGAREHDLEVTRRGSRLSLIFGGGTSTIQTFEFLGDAADAQIYQLSDGALAFANGYFILVSGDGARATTGYGTYEHKGSKLTLSVVRWAQSDGQSTVNSRDTTLTASFDGQVLSLPDGQRFTVVPQS